MIRWTHGHTAGTSVVAGLMIAGNGWLYAAALAGVFLLGVLTGRFWSALRHAAAVAAATAHARLELAQRKMKTEQAKATEIRTRQRHRLRAKQAQQAECDRSYKLGVADGMRSR